MMAAAIVAVAIGVSISVSSFDMTPVRLPGSVTLEMPTPGTVTVGYEPISIIDGVEIASPEDPPLTIVFESGERVVPMEPPYRPARYQWGGRSGKVVGTVELSSGTWRMVGRSPEGDSQSVVYGYGRFRPFRVVAPVLISALVAAVLGPGGLGCLVIGIMLVSRGRKTVRPPAQG